MTSAVVDPVPAASASPTDDGRGYLANGKLSHLPALDGIRGLGIQFVFLYHHEAIFFGHRFHGGMLAVSMFFTLSGFLIARLLHEEYGKNGRLDIKRFYVRRFRRLMPAALVILALIAQLWWLAPPTNGGISFRSWFAAMTYWENWHLISAGREYSKLFADASPMEHMWSLSIEEQVYIVFPLLMAVVFGVAWLRRRAVGVLVTVAAIGFALGAYWSSVKSPEHAYYATEARAAEFLVGAAFAIWWLRSPRVPAIARVLRTPLARVVAALFLIAQVLLWSLIGVQTFGLFPYWVILNAGLTCAAMAFACAESGMTGFLSHPVWVFIGRLSYGLYIVHWPVFLFLSKERVPVTGWMLLSIRLLVSLAIAWTMFHLIENPVRTGKMWKGTVFGVACALLAVTGTAFALANEPSTAELLVDPDAVAAQQRALDELPPLGPDAPTRSAVDPALPARVLVVGDSQAWAVGGRFQEMWGVPHGVDVVPSPGVGCGVTELTPVDYLGAVYDNGFDGCAEWRAALPQIVAKFQPQLVMVIGGFADVADRQLPGSDAWQHIGDPSYDEWLTGQMEDFVDEMTTTGAEVLWFSSPHIVTPKEPGAEPFPQEDPARMDRYNELIRSIAETDDRVEFADLAAFAANRPGGEFDPAFRPDGAHIDLTVAPDLVDWLDGEIRRVTG